MSPLAWFLLLPCQELETTENPVPDLTNPSNFPASSALCTNVRPFPVPFWYTAGPPAAPQQPDCFLQRFWEISSAGSLACVIFACLLHMSILSLLLSSARPAQCLCPLLNFCRTLLFLILVSVQALPLVLLAPKTHMSLSCSTKFFSCFG